MMTTVMVLVLILIVTASIANAAITIIAVLTGACRSCSPCQRRDKRHRRRNGNESLQFHEDAPTSLRERTNGNRSAIFGGLPDAHVTRARRRNDSASMRHNRSSYCLTRRTRVNTTR
ncbi:hypothetical protein [Bradyrhizobium elkanii]